MPPAKGTRLSDEHRAAISAGVRAHRAQVPYPQEARDRIARTLKRRHAEKLVEKIEGVLSTAERRAS